VTETKRLSRVRRYLSGFLTERSVIRNPSRPTRESTFRAVLLMVVVAPAVPVLFMALLFRRIWSEPLRVMNLRIHGEFAYFVAFMEALRGTGTPVPPPQIVLVHCRWRHRTLTDMYEEALHVRILWSVGMQVFIQQILNLQPSSVVHYVSLDFRPLKFTRNYRPNPTPLTLPAALDKSSTDLRDSLNLSRGRLIPFAVHTRAYDLERTRFSAQKGAEKETRGGELPPVVDYLQAEGVSLVLLGSADTGISGIPRRFLRLADFGSLGGAEEVLIAKHCDYFWTDVSGAWLLAFPFKKRILYSNCYTLHSFRGFFNQEVLTLPVRFIDRDGRALRFRDELESNRHFSSHQDLTWIRNSPTEIIEAHREMLALLDGTWRDTDEVVELRSRFKALFKDYPLFNPPRLPAHYLLSHPHLLE